MEQDSKNGTLNQSWKWSTEQLIEEAKKYSTVKEWCKQSRPAYNAAQRRGILDQCCAHMTRAKRSWTDEFIINSAKKYPSRKAWMAAAPEAYKMAEERGIFEKCVEHMKLINGRTQWSWTDEAIMEDARKYQKSSQWKKSSPAAYVAAIRHGILGKCTEHMNKRPRTNWTADLVLQDAKKFDSEIEWSEESKNAFLAAKRLGILDQCVAHMTVRKLRSPRWTEQELLESARLYATRSEWAKKARGAYSAAREKGLLEQCCAHMPKDARVRQAA